MTGYRQIDKCRCCGSEKLKEYLDLGVQPLANDFHVSGSEKKFPLKVMFCEKCFHSQLSIVINPEIMFDNYLWVSGTTNTFMNHFKELAKFSVDKLSNKNECLYVLDIASNDGSLLEKFRELGCIVKGIDPAKNLRKITQKKDIDVDVDYWSYETSKKYVDKFDIITATNVFAHNDDNIGFLQGCKSAIKEDGIIVIEFPYNKKTIQNNEFDQVYCEHLSYFTINSFKTLVDFVALKITSVTEHKIHGGSIRFVLQKEGIEDERLNGLIVSEKKDGLHDYKTYIKFSETVVKTMQAFAYYVNKIKRTNNKVVGYGASAKSSTALNYSNVKLDYIVDENEIKQGLFTPGMNIPILHPKELINEHDCLNVVISAWNFYDEIKEKIKKLRPNKKTYLIRYVPNFNIEVL